MIFQDSVLKAYPELEKMEFFVQPNGSLFKLTKGEFDFIMDIIREENPVKPATETVTKYSKADFLSKVFMTEERYDVLEALLRIEFLLACCENKFLATVLAN